MTNKQNNFPHPIYGKKRSGYSRLALKMDKVVKDLTTLDFKSLDSWEYMWKTGSAVWHIDAVHVYVNNIATVVCIGVRIAWHHA